MRRKTFAVVAVLSFVLHASSLVGGGAAQESNGIQLSLSDAIEIAETTSPSVTLADLALEEARNTYEVSKVSQVSQPSVIARQQAENAWRSAQHTRELARQDLIMHVAQSYYEVLRTEMALELAERALSQSRAQLESTTVRHEQGMLSDVDLLAAESQAATAELELNRARANQVSARMGFNRLLGRDLEAPFELVDELNDAGPIPIDLEEATTHAVKNRAELQRARDTVELREKELHVNDHPYTPPLTLKNLQLAYERAKVELQERELDIIFEVRQNYQAVIEAHARLPIQEKNVIRSQESRRIAEIRYEAGLITSIDLIDAQRAAFQAEMQYIQSIFDYRIALARLSRSAGLPLNVYAR